MVISKAIRDQIEAENANYPRARGGLLAALHRVQREYGAITPEHATALAPIFDMTAVEVLAVVSFYDMLSSQPAGRHQVRVCTNLSCSLAGAREFLREIENHLGITRGETSADGRITLGHEACLGACANAPMMRVDDRYYEDLDTESARQVLDALD